MSDKPALEILRDGLWTSNPGFVQLLGLCPLLATSTSFVNGLSMGLATIFVLAGSNLAISLIRNHARHEVRIPVFVMVIATFVTTVELLMNAWFHDLYRVLGLFLALIVTNCVIIGRAEAFASRVAPHRALLDGFAMGLGFALVLVLLGSLREIIGQGTLFSQAHTLFGEQARDWTWHVFGDDYRGLLLAVLPPGAFIGLGLLVALKNAIDCRLEERRRALAAPAEATPTVA
ncbi:MAG TPA: electron transport complex subunit E [Gammaproteobacteria bacterium]|nr:electron transport complex subunit E [Gammaproteobacteria bacterium]